MAVQARLDALGIAAAGGSGYGRDQGIVTGYRGTSSFKVKLQSRFEYSSDTVQDGH
jgi:hypothetical protein